MDNSSQVQEIYDKIAKDYNGECNEPSEHIEEFLKYIPDKGKILDIGCGTGIDSKHMAQKGYKVTGIDISEGMLAIARTEKVNFIKMDIRDMDFNPESFNGVLASYSLIHIPKKDMADVIKKIKSILKKDGAFFVSIHTGEPNEVSVEEPLLPEERIFLNIMSLDELEKHLTKNNFRIVKMYKRETKSEFEFGYSKLYVISVLD